MSEIAFENKKTGKKYKVVEFDPGAGKVKLVGEHGVEFLENYSKERFEKLGYKLASA